MLGDDIAGALPELRVAAESQMRDRCTITRPDPDAVPGVMDPDTMQYPAVARVTVYAGKCRLQIRSVTAGAKDSPAGERETTLQTPELQIPIDGTDTVAVDDVVEILSAVHDSSLVGRKFTVNARHEKSQATARRLPLSEVTG